MAIFGIGARYGNKDVSKDFIDNKVACIGWDINNAPSIHEILRYIKVGDIIYVKTAPIGKGLRVKAVGVVIDHKTHQNKNLGTCVSVRWIWNGYKNIGIIDDKYNVRNNTLYEELDNTVRFVPPISV